MKILSNGKYKVVVFDEKKQKLFEEQGFKELEQKKKSVKKEEKGEE